VIGVCYVVLPIHNAGWYFIKIVYSSVTGDADVLP
jgi:hypothetical protein